MKRLIIGIISAITVVLLGLWFWMENNNNTTRTDISEIVNQNNSNDSNEIFKYKDFTISGVDFSKKSDLKTYQYESVTTGKVEFKLPVEYSYLSENEKGSASNPNGFLLLPQNKDLFKFSRRVDRSKEVTGDMPAEIFSVKVRDNPREISLNQWISSVHSSLENPTGYGRVILVSRKEAVYSNNASFCNNISVFVMINSSSIIEFKDSCGESEINSDGSLKLGQILINALDSFKLLE